MQHPIHASHRSAAGVQIAYVAFDEAESGPAFGTDERSHFIQIARMAGSEVVQTDDVLIQLDRIDTALEAPDADRAALQSEAARHTALTNLFTGRPARGIVNRVMRELGALSPSAPAFPLATAAMAPLRARAEAQGSGDFSPLWSGQNASGCRAVGAAELTRALAGG